VRAGRHRPRRVGRRGAAGQHVARVVGVALRRRQADVAALPHRVRVVERVAPRTLLVAARVAAVVVPAEAVVGVRVDVLGVAPRDLPGVNAAGVRGQTRARGAGWAGGGGPIAT